MPSRPRIGITGFVVNQITVKKTLTRSAREFDACGGLTTQVGGARLIIERRTKFISSGDSESPVTDFEVDRDAEIFENYHITNPNHGQGVFASSWRSGSEKD